MHRCTNHGAITVPSLHHHCTIAAPSLRHHQEEWFWWAIVDVTRKTMVTTAVFIAQPFGTGPQACLVLVIMIAALVAHTRACPFQSQLVDTVEFVAFSVGVLILILGFILVAVEETEVDRSTFHLWLGCSILLLVGAYASIVLYTLCRITTERYHLGTVP